MSHVVRVAARAEKELDACPADIRERMLDAIRQLRDDPHPREAKRLKGRHAGRCRLRVGGYRALYEVRQHEREVWVLKIGPRPTIYR